DGIRDFHVTGVQTCALPIFLTREGTRVLVQCKRWQSWKVGTEEVRSFAGVLRRNGESASGGIFVTLSRFTEYAEREARELGIAQIGRASCREGRVGWEDAGR